MSTISSLELVSPDTLFEAFSQAFADYEIQLEKEELFAMLKRRGFDPVLSFGAFEGERLVAFTFNGTGLFDGERTAYDTGTGTLKEFRGRGLASEVFKYSIPYLQKAGIKQYLLEVLQHNEKAVSVYRKLGFEVSREFHYFVKAQEEIEISKKSLDANFTVKKVEQIEMEQAESFFEFPSSWQNSFESISRSNDDFLRFAAFRGDENVGYCIFEPVSGDVTQLAVDKSHRRKGIATALLKEMMKHNKHTNLKIINTEVDCESITAFLQANSIEPEGKQFEMVRRL